MYGQGQVRSQLLTGHALQLMSMLHVYRLAAFVPGLELSVADSCCQEWFPDLTCDGQSQSKAEVAGSDRAVTATISAGIDQ